MYTYVEELSKLAPQSLSTKVANADFFFAHFRIYKNYIVLRRSLLKEQRQTETPSCSHVISGMHGLWPDAKGPGIALHLASLAAWVGCGVQTNPLLSAGLWAGGRNQMNKAAMWSVARAAARLIGYSALGHFAFIFQWPGLYYSFRFPGEGPFRPVCRLPEPLRTYEIVTEVTFAATVAHIRVRDAQSQKELAKVS
eukprot:Skav234234  [mRNA]  locus=scaffold1464:358427:364196:+ [translate_table: standard]